MIKLKIEAFDSGLKPLMRHQKPYFAGHETAVIKSLLNLRSQAAGNPIAHVVDDALLNFIDMVDSDLGTNILLRYVDPYVEERNRYDESQSTAGVPQLASLVLTLKCLAILIKKLAPPQLDFNMAQISPLVITVIPRPRPMFPGGLMSRHCMMKILRLDARVLPCVLRCSSLCRTRVRFSRHYEGLKKIPVSRIFCIIISNTQGDKVMNWRPRTTIVVTV